VMKEFHARDYSAEVNLGVTGKNRTYCLLTGRGKAMIARRPCGTTKRADIGR